jgi:hypothetical protein
MRPDSPAAVRQQQPSLVRLDDGVDEPAFGATYGIAILRLSTISTDDRNPSATSQIAVATALPTKT